MGNFEDVLSVVAAVATIDASLETETAGDRTSVRLISPSVTCCPCAWNTSLGELMEVIEFIRARINDP